MIYHVVKGAHYYWPSQGKTATPTFGSQNVLQLEGHEVDSAKRFATHLLSGGSVMKVRCCCCHNQLGLGFRSKVFWESNAWGYRRYRFCGTKCIELFMQMRQAVGKQKSLTPELSR
jgi:hypothetical protein